MELCPPYRTSATVCYAKDKADALSFAMPPVPGFYITILTRIFAQQTALQAMLSKKDRRSRLWPLLRAGSAPSFMLRYVRIKS